MKALRMYFQRNPHGHAWFYVVTESVGCAPSFAWRCFSLVLGLCTKLGLAMLLIGAWVGSFGEGEVDETLKLAFVNAFALGIASHVTNELSRLCANPVKHY